MLIMEKAWYQKLRDRRIELGLKPGELGKAAGLTRQAINAIENGDVKYPRYETITAIAAQLGWTTVDVFGAEEPALVGASVGEDVDEIIVNLLAVRRADPREYQWIREEIARRRAWLEASRVPKQGSEEQSVDDTGDKSRLDENAGGGGT